MRAFRFALAVLLIAVLIASGRSSARAQAGGLTNGDFESGNLSGWTVVSGTAFSNSSVVSGDLYASYVLRSNQPNGDSAIGIIRSNTWTLANTTIDLLTAGLYVDSTNEYVSLVRALDGTKLFTETGSGSGGWSAHTWDVRPYVGTDCYIEIGDLSTTKNISVDRILLYDIPDDAPTTLANGDFETGDLTGWETWYAGPSGAGGVIAGASTPRTGYSGSYFLSTYWPGSSNANTSVIRSGFFRIAYPTISLLVGAYDRDPDFCYIALKRAYDGQILFKAYGLRDGLLEFDSYSWDVSAYSSTIVYFEVVDQSSSKNINIDAITFSGTPIPTYTPTNTPTTGATNTFTPTNTPTHTRTPTNTPTITPTPSNTPTPSITPTRTPTSPASQTPIPSATRTPSATPDPCVTVNWDFRNSPGTWVILQGTFQSGYGILQSGGVINIQLNPGAVLQNASYSFAFNSLGVDRTINLAAYYNFSPIPRLNGYTFTPPNAQSYDNLSAGNLSALRIYMYTLDTSASLWMTSASIHYCPSTQIPVPPTATFTPSNTNTPTNTATPTPSNTFTPTITLTPSNTFTPTATATNTPYTPSAYTPIPTGQYPVYWDLQFDACAPGCNRVEETILDPDGLWRNPDGGAIGKIYVPPQASGYVQRVVFGGFVTGTSGCKDVAVQFGATYTASQTCVPVGSWVELPVPVQSLSATGWQDIQFTNVRGKIARAEYAAAPTATPRNAPTIPPFLTATALYSNCGMWGYCDLLATPTFIPTPLPATFPVSLSRAQMISMAQQTIGMYNYANQSGMVDKLIFASVAVAMIGLMFNLIRQLTGGQNAQTHDNPTRNTNRRQSRRRR